MNVIDIDEDILNDFTKKLKIDILPNDLKISTMTICCKLDVIFNLINIAKYIDITQHNIINISFGDLTNIKTNRGYIIRKKKAKHRFLNQASLYVVITNDKYVNVKLFNNGAIQMTGCQTVKQVIIALQKLFNELKKTKIIIRNKQFIEMPFTSDSKQLHLKYVSKLKTCLINSDFKFPMIVNRIKLYRLMLFEKYNVYFDIIRRHSVNIKYYSDDHEITILVFEKNSILITGGTTCKHLLDAYNFINKYLLINQYYVINHSFDL